MKNRKMFGAGVVLMLLAVFTCVSVAGTYAKYTTELAGTSTATVAKWAWKVGEADILSAATETFTFDLFSTVAEADATTTEGHVKTGLIAPGTGGKFDLIVKNESEVAATVGYVFNETNTSNVPIEYSLTGVDGTWKTAAAFSQDTKTLAVGADATTVTVYWRWAFEGADSENYTSSQTDPTDTALGFAANTTAPTVTLAATLTLTQVD